MSCRLAKGGSGTRDLGAFLRLTPSASPWPFTRPAQPAPASTRQTRQGAPAANPRAATSFARRLLREPLRYLWDIWKAYALRSAAARSVSSARRMAVGDTSDGKSALPALGQRSPPPPLPILFLSSPEPHRSLSVAPLIRNQRCYGEATVRVGRYGAVVAGNGWEAAWG